ncbi:MAG: restriction endonuclease [Candidatus Binataceae bacterium]
MIDQLGQQELNAKQYELLTKSVYEAILKTEGVTNVEVLHNQEVAGRFGGKHQIDVLWRFRQAAVEHAVLVECKNFSSNLEIAHVRNFHAVLVDIGNTRGIMVTRVGYQKGAAEFAKHYGIGLKILRRPTESDWEGRVRNINVNIHIKMLWNDRDHPVSVAPHWVVRDEEQATRLRTVRQDDDSWFQQIFDSKGNVRITEIGSWLGRQLPVLEKEQGGPYQHSIDLSDAFFRLTLGDGSTELFQASKLDVTYYVTAAEEKLSIWGDEVVRYILRDFLSGQVEHVIRR